MAARGLWKFYLAFLWQRIFPIGINGDSNLTAEIMKVFDSAYGYHRGPNLPPRGGTVSWERMSQGPAMFSPRHSHATCVFRCPNDNDKQCIWLTGGRSDEHYAYNLVRTTQNDDVWWSDDGVFWNKVLILDGDFLSDIGNSDAKPKGEAAPWFGRYGHSLDAIDVDGDGVLDVMILTGGYSPVQSNDVWLSRDGTNWYFDGFATFPPRAYHATAVFQRKLWILGGTPLTNDIWAGTPTMDSTKKAGYSMKWKQMNKETPWFPRMGSCAVTQMRPALFANDSMDNVESNDKNEVIEYLYIMGGFGGHPRDDKRYNGERARNDVWVTSNGMDWKRVLPPKPLNTMPWIGRSFHSCITWHDSNNATLRAGKQRKDSKIHSPTTIPRIYIMGGGYFGTKKNNFVRSLEAYLDTWWTIDGSIWHRVDYMEGSGPSLYSSSEWALSGAMFDGQELYRGKWGHTVELFFTREDFNSNGKISNGNVQIDFFNDRDSASKSINRTMFADEGKVPALFIIAGKPEGKPMVNDIFVTRPGFVCELEGITCSGRGACGPGLMGCVCDSPLYIGEYCEKLK